MKKGATFAGPLANSNVPELGSPAESADDKPAPEDPAVFGGRMSDLPVGTVVEWPEEGGYKVVSSPEE